jgi:hypothetical protein
MMEAELPKQRSQAESLCENSGEVFNPLVTNILLGMEGAEVLLRNWRSYS